MIKCLRRQFSQLLQLKEKQSIGQSVRLNGWIKSVRPASSNCLFMTLSDCQETVQLVVSRTKAEEQYDTLCHLPLESAVTVHGMLKERPAVSKRTDSKLGCFEVEVDRIDILNRAEPLPLIFKDNIMPDEDKRLEFRYLDLRRPKMQANIRLRSKVVHSIRNYLHEQGFIDIETPLLFKSTPEGAKEFIVDRGDGTCFALPQSPQQFKQLLVIGGFEKYYQVAKCFRNEDLRADRQPEFTQLDIEMGFAKSEDVMNVIEGIVNSVFTQHLNIIPKFRTISYDDALAIYGSDKPDLRGEWNIESVPKNGTIAEEVLSVPSALVTEGMIREFESTNLEGTLTKTIRVQDDIHLFTASRSLRAHVGLTQLGKIRLSLLNSLELPHDISQFLWVRDFPLLYQSPSGQIQSMHHPFTVPLDEHIDLLKIDPLAVRAHHYDLVLNGVEIGGGSARIHDPKLQESIMRDYLKLEAEKIQLFKHLLDALKCGAPPHAGIALGLDRLMTIITGSQSIRDVIAFPKNSSGHDLLFKTPTPLL